MCMDKKTWGWPKVPQPLGKGWAGIGGWGGLTEKVRIMAARIKQQCEVDPELARKPMTI